MELNRGDAQALTAAGVSDREELSAGKGGRGNFLFRLYARKPSQVWRAFVKNARRWFHWSHNIQVVAGACYLSASSPLTPSAIDEWK